MITPSSKVLLIIACVAGIVGVVWAISGRAWPTTSHQVVPDTERATASSLESAFGGSLEASRHALARQLEDSAVVAADGPRLASKWSGDIGLFTAGTYADAKAFFLEEGVTPPPNFDAKMWSESSLVLSGASLVSGTVNVRKSVVAGVRRPEPDGQPGFGRVSGTRFDRAGAVDPVAEGLDAWTIRTEVVMKSMQGKAFQGFLDLEYAVRRKDRRWILTRITFDHVPEGASIIMPAF